MNGRGSEGCDQAALSAVTAITPPANGVHKPISNSIAAPAITSSTMTGDGEETVSSPV